MKRFRLLLACALLCGSVPAVASDCEITLTNCLSDKFQWCSYDGDSTWDKLVAADDETLDAGQTQEYYPCNEDDSCYFIGTEFKSVVWWCTSSSVTGSADCGSYACVDESDGSLTWNTSTTAFCCSDDACSTDCS